MTEAEHEAQKNVEELEAKGDDASNARAARDGEADAEKHARNQ